MAFTAQGLAEVSQRLLDELTDGGTRDLTQMSLTDIEQAVYQGMDQVTQRVLQGVLEDQAPQANPDFCPTCNSGLEERPPDEKALQMERCQVEWKQPVKRCLKCRRDFFPSVGHAGDFGRADV